LNFGFGSNCKSSVLEKVCRALEKKSPTPDKIRTDPGLAEFNRAIHGNNASKNLASQKKAL
jgi:hypothetical protein